MARRKLNIKQNPVMFIACEGTSSEYQYFRSWAETDQALAKYNQVDVYPGANDKNPKTTPYEMYQLAKTKLEQGSIDVAWIVFDKDNHPKLPDTFIEAKKIGINIAFSSRSFEQWVILHFEKNRMAFNATECKDAHDKPTGCGSSSAPSCTPTECLTGHIRRNSFIMDYSKKKDFDIFTKIKEKTEIALVNSAWLRGITMTSINSPQPLLHSLNPYTDVDQLILQLNSRNDIVEWGNAGENVSLEGWTINTTIKNGHIELMLLHQYPTAQLINSVFRTESFFTTNDNLENNPSVVINNAFLVNNSESTDQLLYPGDQIVFTLAYDGKPYFLFKVEQRLMIYIAL